MKQIGAGGAQPLLDLRLYISTQPQGRGILRQNAEHRRRQGLTHVLRPLEALVEQLLDKNPHIAQDQPGQQPHRYTGDHGGGPSGARQLGGGQQRDPHWGVGALQLLHLCCGLPDDLIGQDLSLTGGGRLDGDLHRHGLGCPRRVHRGGQFLGGDVELERVHYSLGDSLRGEDRDNGVSLHAGELRCVVVGLRVLRRISSHLYMQVRLSLRRVGARRHESEHY